MSTRKYVPPHKRRDSASRPPPASAYDAYRHDQQQRTRTRAAFRAALNINPHAANPRFNRYRHSRHYHANETTLEETKLQDTEIETVCLDEYVVARRQQKHSIVQIVSEHTDQDTANLIYEFCSDDTILIANTFDRAEFLRHWLIPNKGDLANIFRDLHRVDLYADRLQLTRRGCVVSIKGYKPSKRAKLRFECRFKYHDERDFMTLSLRSNGTRQSNLRYAKYGELHVGRNKVRLHRTEIECTGKDRDGLIVQRYTEIEPWTLNTELCVVMIDDGETVKAKYWSAGSDACYTVQSDSSAASQFYRVCVWNRETKHAIADVTFLQLSIVTNDA